MSVTGPGCPACGFTGRVPFDPAHPFVQRPCSVCSPWSHAVGFPGVDLRESAAAILAGTEAADDAMREWAQRLVEYAADVDAGYQP